GQSLRLVEDGGGLRAPGETVRLSCRGSGFSFGNSTVWWYRQAAGGSLEWVSYKSSDTSVIEFGQSVEGRATVFWDSSWSELYLSLRDLQPRDSARYFCAVNTLSHRDRKSTVGQGAAWGSITLRRRSSWPFLHTAGILIYGKLKYSRIVSNKEPGNTFPDTSHFPSLLSFIPSFPGYLETSQPVHPCLLGSQVPFLRSRQRPQAPQYGGSQRYLP
uniref:Ig-like domain-containing protein n=1 Tax=Buteo japonicus TaxID=224669 RepID=A0A8B9Z0N4_9AVES